MKPSLSIMPEVRKGPFGIFPLQGVTRDSSPLRLPPFTDEVFFAELDNPQVGRVSAHNRSSEVCFVPAGWILEGLNQTRMLKSGGIVRPGARIELDVVCIERGRWGSFRQSTDGGRAPLSVLLASGIVSNSKLPSNANSIQSQVWTEVSKHESANGLRATSSLAQVMNEDFETDSFLSSLRREIDELVLHPGANGFVITMNGQVLMAEWFSHPAGVEGLLKKTLQGFAFDAKSSLHRPSRNLDVVNISNRLLEFPEATIGSTATELVVSRTDEAMSGMFHLLNGELHSSQIFNTNHDFMKGSIYV